MSEKKIELELQKKAKHDVQLRIAKAQGYVVEGCYLPGFVVMLLIQKGENPCAGCNNDRSVCGGKPK